MSSSQDSIPLYVDQYVSFAVSQSNHQHVAVLMETLHTLVSQGYAQPRLVCEILLKYLDIRNTIVWTLSLDLVHKLVGGVHYKGCRDLMKLLFNIFDCLPRNVPEQQTTALLKGQEVSKWPLTFTCILLSSLPVVAALYSGPKQHTLASVFRSR